MSTDKKLAKDVQKIQKSVEANLALIKKNAKKAQGFKPSTKLKYKSKLTEFETKGLDVSSKLKAAAKVIDDDPTEKAAITAHAEFKSMLAAAKSMDDKKLVKEVQLAVDATSAMISDLKKYIDAIKKSDSSLESKLAKIKKNFAKIK